MVKSYFFFTISVQEKDFSIFLMFVRKNVPSYFSFYLCEVRSKYCYRIENNTSL